MAGCMFSVGVGPGDPQLMTLRAVRCIKASPVIVIPTADKTKCVAYEIARQEVPEIEEKDVIALSLPMVKDSEIVRAAHKKACEIIAEVLDSGRDVAFLTLGDPTVYATTMYIHKKIVSLGYNTEIISGVPSFCAAAARLGEPLVMGEEQLHLIPGSYDIEEAMSLSGTRIIMKTGKNLPYVRTVLNNNECKVMAVENCGMVGERVWLDAADMPEDSSYYTLIIAKDEQQI